MSLKCEFEGAISLRFSRLVFQKKNPKKIPKKSQKRGKIQKLEFFLSPFFFKTQCIAAYAGRIRIIGSFSVIPLISDLAGYFSEKTESFKNNLRNVKKWSCFMPKLFSTEFRVEPLKKRRSS